MIFAFATNFKGFTYPDSRGSQIQQDLCPTYALSFESKNQHCFRPGFATCVTVGRPLPISNFYPEVNQIYITTPIG